MTRLYEREIKDFFEVAKIKMAGTSKDGKGKFGKTSIKTFFICLLGNLLERDFCPCCFFSLCMSCVAMLSVVCVCVCVCVPFVIYVFSYTNVKLHDKQLVSTQLH